MAFNILEHVALAYQPVWGSNRQLVGVRLQVRALNPESVDAAHLLHWLETEWFDESPRLLVSFADTELLQQALGLTPQPSIWLELPAWQDDLPADWGHSVALALSHGHVLVQNATLAQAKLGLSRGRGPERYVLQLQADQIEQALQAAQQSQAMAAGQLPRADASGMGQQRPGLVRSPVLANQLYQHVTTRALAAHCLDEQRAWGMCGWPMLDTLEPYRLHGVPVDRLTLVRVQQALLHERPMDVVENLILQDPVLTYRVLQLVNSSVFGASREVNTIRQALMLLGQKILRDWLLELMPGASSDRDLVPVRQTMVLRAQLMTYLMDAGAQAELGTEIYVTGLFSQLHLLLHEPPLKMLQRLPIPERMVDALLRHSGPYFAYLDLARRLEQFQTPERVLGACEEYQFPLDTVNRALLRMLARWRNQL